MGNRARVIGWTVFETEIGACAIAWSGQGIAGAQLPEADAAALRARLQRRFAGASEQAAPPAWLQPAIERLQALLGGRSTDRLLDLPLDESGIPAFPREVYALTRQIAVGQTRSYGELAALLGQPGAARAVGAALGQNPFAPIVPCHRVLGADAALVGFSAHGGLDSKRRLLLIEARAAGQLGGEQQLLF